MTRMMKRKSIDYKSASYPGVYKIHHKNLHKFTVNEVFVGHVKEKKTTLTKQ